MTSAPGVKICGITDPKSLEAACSAGARYVGFVFYEPSPRHLSFDTAWNLVRGVPTGVRSVGLFVNPDDEYLERIVSGVPLDMIQLHGQESPGRIAEIKERYNMPVMKAIPIASADDLKNIAGFEAAADWLLFDAKPTDGSASGGKGEAFDWNILKDYKGPKPWMLAGGLHAGNIAEALSILCPDALDVSSGVESTPGQKDPEKIKEFIEKAQKA